MSNVIVCCLFYSVLIIITTSSTTSTTKAPLYTIEGQIVLPPDENNLGNIRILVDEGLYIGVPHVDGTFTISGVPSGSYIVSVNSPFHIFEPVRVDINKKGKIRARAVNFIEPGKVTTKKYPLRFEVHSKPNYFQKREVYRVTDLFSNPLFLQATLLVVSLLFLPKLMPQGEDLQGALQQTNGLFQPNPNMPDITDWFIRLFGAPTRQRPTRN
ncbi:unnamed protein product [Adineta steineri]|uniref:ER membrane protein complex subunit 7 beta-sandwich domain-containing protein n=1 Tax=Adineta steineri TaxID=433720 RepID=A0A819JY73_9BILA|nr:unnamed protein product [Adineta steineri]CAF3936926.1 unnamed protein product [Adineta steineri]